jgi:hypothetical protein
MNTDNEIKISKLSQIEKKIKKISKSNFEKNFLYFDYDDCQFLINEIKNLQKKLDNNNKDVLEFTESFLKNSIGSIEWEDLRQKAKLIMRKYSNV